MKVIAIISDIKVNNIDNYSFYDEITVDIMDHEIGSIKHVVPKFDKDGNYKIGELICYDTTNNSVDNEFDKLYDVEILSLFIMRYEYNQMLINCLKEENDYIMDAKKDGNYVQVNKYKNLNKYLKQNQEKMNKIRTIIKTLDTCINVVNKYFNDNNNNFTKKRK